MWLQRNGEQERNDVTEMAEEHEGEDGDAATEIPAGVETPVAFTPTMINIAIPSPSLQAIEISPVFRNAEAPPDAFTDDDQITTTSSPVSSISTVSNLTPTEFDEDIGEDSGERIPTRHETFYLEGGNIEVVCGQSVFRVHSSTLSSSSPILRDMLSSSTLSGPMQKGCPRVVFEDNAEDFAVLLKVIYTPGYISPSLDVWALCTDQRSDD